MFTGAHVLIYTTNPDADRAFVRDVLEFRSVDIGHGWMIFTLPPAEAALHPGDGEFAQRHAGHEMPGALVYLMCDDLKATMAALADEQRRVHRSRNRSGWGIRTTIMMPSGGEIGLYQPTHQTALDLYDSISWRPSSRSPHSARWFLPADRRSSKPRRGLGLQPRSSRASTASASGSKDRKARPASAIHPTTASPSVPITSSRP